MLSGLTVGLFATGSTGSEASSTSVSGNGFHTFEPLFRELFLLDNSPRDMGRDDGSSLRSLSSPFLYLALAAVAAFSSAARACEVKDGPRGGISDVYGDEAAACEDVKAGVVFREAADGTRSRTADSGGRIVVVGRE